MQRHLSAKQVHSIHPLRKIATLDQRKGGPKLKDRLKIAENRVWCGREDSNLHGIATASPSSWCVCQFRHCRTRVMETILAAMPVARNRIRSTFSEAALKQELVAVAVAAALQAPELQES